MKHIWLKCAAVVAAGLMGSIGGFVPRAWAAVGAGVWTTGNTWETYTPSENNLLSLKYLVQNGEYNDFLICKEFNNDSIYLTRGDAGKGWGSSAHTVTLKFPSAATITWINFYTKWGDNGRVYISLNAMKVKHSDGTLEEVANSKISYGGSNMGTNPEKRFACFAAADGSPIAEDVVEVQLDFPQQQNSAVGYVGMEVVGTLSGATEGPTSEMVWEAGGYDTSAWTPLVASSNMMLTYRSGTLKQGSVTTYYDYMTDGELVRCPANGNYLVYPNQKVQWNFAQAITLQSLRVYTWWGNGGDGVGIFHVDTQDKDGVWTSHLLPTEYVLVGTATGFETHEGNEVSNYAILRRRDGKPIAEDIVAIRVLAAFEQSACWVEVEAEGWTDTSPAIFDETSVTVANDCWDVNWTAKVSSLGASTEATVNLLTSLDGVNFTVADTKVVTEVNTATAFTHTYDDVNQTIYYKFEIVNTKDGKEWRSTNGVATVVNRDNATYYWNPAVTSGVWNDAANWTNSRNDTRLKWPTDQYTTADFSRLAAGDSVTVSVDAAHTSKLTLAPAGAEVVFTGPTALTPSGDTLVTGRMVMDGSALRLGAILNFADGACLVAKNNAALNISSVRLNGAQSRLELLSGSTLAAGTKHSHISGDSEILLDGGSVTEGGYMLWSGEGTPNTGRLTFGLKGGTYKTTQSHCMEYNCTFTFRYLLPGDRWTGYETAPLKAHSVVPGDYHHFGNVSSRGGKFHVELVASSEGLPANEVEIPLIEMVNDTIWTNHFTFTAFGNEMEVGVPRKGDYFYWTYDGGDAREPATAGTLPTGLRFHLSKHGGFCIRIQ